VATLMAGLLSAMALGAPLSTVPMINGSVVAAVECIPGR
jgi:hypothetical protein